MTTGTPVDIIHRACGINSVVECHLAKVKVASSNLVFRSNEPPELVSSGGFLLCLLCRLRYSFIRNYCFLNHAMIEGNNKFLSFNVISESCFPDESYRLQYEPGMIEFSG